MAVRMSGWLALSFVTALVALSAANNSTTDSASTTASMTLNSTTAANNSNSTTASVSGNSTTAANNSTNTTASVSGPSTAAANNGTNITASVSGPSTTAASNSNNTTDSASETADGTTASLTTTATNPTSNDRNGGWTDWSSWGTCSVTCGSNGEHNRTRECTNPTPVGNGTLCSGNTTETQSCNVMLCPEQLDNGVTVFIAGMSLNQYESIESRLKDIVANGTNAHCSKNQANAQLCCNTANTFSGITGLKFVPDASSVEVAAFRAFGPDGMSIVIYIPYDDTNELCGSAATKRKRRSLSNLGQGVLLDVLNDDAIFEAIEVVIFEETGQNFTVGSVAISTQLASAITTTIGAVSTAKSGGVKTWVIAVAVVGAIIAVAIIVIVAVVLLKRPRKVEGVAVDNS